VKDSNAARVGDAVGVRVWVEVTLGLGVIVDVGGWVFVGVCVNERVLLGTTDQVGVRVDAVDLLQAVNQQLSTKTTKNSLIFLLFGDGEE
jgi:hypothetical protein